MKLPVIHGVIERRILVNYRVNPTVLASLLPPPFRPKLIDGVAMAGICLIRLGKVRPAFLPAWMGFSSENAAHRIAVEWDAEDGVRQGVYVHRRDTNSRLNALAGGRLFPGYHYHAMFVTKETPEHYEVALHSDDGITSMSVSGRPVAELTAGSVFHSLDKASAFFEAGSLGYSDTPHPGKFQGLELRCRNWSAQPLEVKSVHSSYFADDSLFPKGSVEFDSALLMRNIEHQWHSHQDLCCTPSPATRTAAG